MKKLTILTIAISILMMCAITNAVTTNLEALAKTPYPHWHYFDPAMGNQIGRDPFFVSGNPSVSSDSAGPNRGNGSDARQFSFMDGNNKLVVKYDVSSLGNQAYYLLQMANNYSLEFSLNGTDWVFISSNKPPYTNPATQESDWQDKPLTNEAPFCFDLSTYLPADDFYVRIGDASTGNGWGGKAFNALISKYGYPYFYGGGSEPDTDSMNGDQQWLYHKDGCPDVTHGRYADLKHYFTYKLDLPDDDDTCWLHARVRGQFIFEIARDSLFSSVDLVYSNNPGDTTTRTLNIDISDVLELTSDNLIYVRVRNSAPAGGNGGQLYNFWISPQPNISSTTSYLPVSEEEIQILWENDAFNNTAHQRFTDYTAHLTYRVNFDPFGTLDMSVAGEYLIDVSTDNANWTTIFNAGAGARDTELISYNPFSGATPGIGTTGNHPVLCPNWIDGMTNVLYVRISDADTSTGWGGLVAGLTVDTASNSVLNHSFNEGLPSPNESAPADWNQDASGGTMGRIFDDSSDAGTNCQFLTQPTITAGNHSNLRQLDIAISAPRTICWSAAYKILSDPVPSGQAVIQVRAWSAAEVFLGQDQFYPSSAGTLDAWIDEPTREWVLPAGTDHLDILADQGTWSPSEMSGTIYVDDFYLEPLPQPAQQASNLASDGTGDTSIDLSWTDGNGDGRLIVCREGDEPSSAPVDWTDYTANSTFGSGSSLGDGSVVYKSTGNSVTIDGLTANTDYYFQAYEYNGSTTPNYNTGTATDNPVYITTTPEPGMFFGIIALGLSIIRIKK